MWILRLMTAGEVICKTKDHFRNQTSEDPTGRFMHCLEHLIYLTANTGEPVGLMLWKHRQLLQLGHPIRKGLRSPVWKKLEPFSKVMVPATLKTRLLTVKLCLYPQVPRSKLVGWFQRLIQSDRYSREFSILDMSVVYVYGYIQRIAWTEHLQENHACFYTYIYIPFKPIPWYIDRYLGKNIWRNSSQRPAGKMTSPSHSRMTGLCLPTRSCRLSFLARHGAGPRNGYRFTTIHPS